MDAEIGLWARYWSFPVVQVNLLVFANLVGALMLGLVVGYERSYHSRAAGMRTYGIVCMASAGLTVFAAYPGFWWGMADTVHVGAVDPTRVIQGIITGIGFLGAGVIMRDGFTISGLTTAASIWATSAIGVLVGVGFYTASILLTVLTASLMMWGTKLEARLPARQAMAVTLTFEPGMEPDERTIGHEMTRWGFEMASGSLHINRVQSQITWQFVMVAQTSRPAVVSLFELSRQLHGLAGVHNVQLAHARN